MGIINVTPDSFSGDGLLAETEGEGGGGAGARTRSRSPSRRVAGWSRRARTSSTSAANRRGRATNRSRVDEERRRVVPVIAALRAALPDTPLSIDTTKPAVAEAALAAGADLVNDVWGVFEDDSLARLAADHGVPLVVMHNRAEAATRRSSPRSIADLQRAIERALALGVALGRPDRRSGVRVRQDRRAQPRADARTGQPDDARPADPARGEPQVDAGTHPRPAGRRSGSRRRWQRLRSGSPAGPTSSGSTMSRPNVRAARISDAIVRGTWQPEPEGGPT